MRISHDTLKAKQQLPVPIEAKLYAPMGFPE